MPLNYGRIGIPKINFDHNDEYTGIFGVFLEGKEAPAAGLDVLSPD